MTLTIGSLFSGIGGLELGLERAGLGPVAWQVEREPYCHAVLAKHWPDAARFDDVCTVGAHTLAPVDVICGGFPCQPHSSAGLRKGSDDERDLWGEYARIVRELRPRYVVAENVPGVLTSDDGRFFNRVLSDLAALGFDAEWSVLSACALGAPHPRERLFVLAHRAEVLSTGGAPHREHEARRSHTSAGRTESRDGAGSRGRREHWWVREPDVARVVHGVSAGLVDAPIGALGNAVVPQVAEVVGRLIVAREAALAMEAA